MTIPAVTGRQAGERTLPGDDYMLQFSTLGATELRRADGTSVDSILAAPKRIALLTYLTLARPRGFHRRDVLLAMLWPELDQERGRGTLRTTLYHLRQALGADVLQTRGSDEVGIDRNELSCDAIQFERLLDEGLTAQALALYSGPLLTGVFVSGLAEWERWLETERARLRERAMAAAWSLAEDAASAGRAEAANRWARRAHEIHPDDEGSLRRLISVLDRIGDRAGAIGAYDAFARGLWTEYESEPAPETRQAVESVRQRAGLISPLPLPLPAIGPRVDPPAEILPAIAAETQAPPKRRIGPYHLAAGLAALIVAGVGIVRAGSAPPVIAVGQIEMLNMPDSLGALPVVLGTNLARVPGLRIVSETRLHELLASLQSKRRPGADLTHAAAAAAGADEIIEGTLSQRSRGGYRLDLQRVDLAAGETRGAFTIESTEVFELIDLATEWVANELGAQVPLSRHASTVSSLVAYRLYENGLSAFYRGDIRAAERFFRTALTEDSTFAMAAYFLSRAVNDEGEIWSTLERAERLSRRAIDRERLVIRAAWAFHMQDPTRLAVAETLVARYPLEPESHLLYADALMGAGAFHEAIPHVRGLLDVEPRQADNPQLRCWPCEAYGRLAELYFRLDSFPAIVREARREIAQRPDYAPAWYRLAQGYSGLEQYDRSRDALLKGLQLAGEDSANVVFTDLYIRRGDFDALDRGWQQKLPGADRSRRESIYGDQSSQYRTQGRFREALTAAMRIRELAGQPPSGPESTVLQATPLATVLMDAGHYAEAAALYDSIANTRYSTNLSRNARHRAWALAHAATAYAALGDTARLRVLEDTVRVVGSSSAYMRDQLLHHYIRGLRLKAQKRPQEAVAAFQRAIYSTTSGYVRLNLELARTYLELSRPADAAAILEAALRGPTGATGMYASRTELQYVLGQAYEQLDDGARAAVQYRRVLHAWAHADPEIASRRELVRQRLAALTKGKPGPLPHS